MKPCPAFNCSNPTRDGDFACWFHWSKVTKSMKMLISKAFFDLQYGIISDALHAEFIESMCAKLGWADSKVPFVGTLPGEAPFVCMPTTGLCRRCKRRVTIARTNSLEGVFEVEEPPFTVDLDESVAVSEQEVCVVGGVAYPATHEFVRPGHTRFVPHHCGESHGLDDRMRPSLADQRRRT